MHLTKEKFIKLSMISSIIILCVAIVLVILFGVQQFKIGSQLASVNQVSNLSHLLIRQQANLLSMLLVNNANTEQLTESLDAFAKEEFVLDASIYSNRGELLAHTSHFQNLRLTLGLNSPTQPDEENTQQIVEPIYSVNGIEGFLRVTFDSKYGKTTQSKIDHLFHQLYGELIIIFLAGVLLASSIHYFLSHYRRTYRKVTENKAVKVLKTKQNVGSYHRRRRRLNK
ncbi:YtjB family periplasmic protein [Pasteurella multocida]|uniref:YtjB family periplasmic protein n=1 Tax=Pasteurella multocida TaxID=747 RepID=UPI0028DD8CE7|nr:YtjB family periplasmic protein [Pasteurella multocida]MDT8767935.1 YtjB family periplasmic protein [Pasteurella multocida]